MKKIGLHYLRILIIGGIVVLVSCNKKEGCTDANGTNYNSEAEKDDGTCIYTTVTDSNWTVVNTDTTSIIDTAGVGNIVDTNAIVGNQVCIEGELDTACLNGTSWGYTLTILDSTFCIGTFAEGTFETDSGTLIINTDSVFMYGSDHDFVVFDIINSTSSITDWRDEEGGDTITWSVLQDDLEQRTLFAERPVMISDSCNAKMSFFLTMQKITQD